MSNDKKQPPITGPGMTLPVALKTASSTYGKKTWMRKKLSGLWHEYSWHESYDKVRHFSLGLTSLGFQPGQPLCIIGDSDPQWFWAEIAAQAAGGSALGVNRSLPAEELKVAILQFRIKLAVVQDRDVVDRLLEIKGELPSLTKIIYWNARGIETDQDPLLVSFDEVVKTGRNLESSQSGSLDESISRVKPSDTAVITVNSVDVSAVQPKTLTHEELFTAIEGLRSTESFKAGDRWFSFIMPEGIVEQAACLAGSLTSGMCVDFPESREMAQQDLREVGSTLVCYPSAAWETLAATVKDRIEKTTLAKRAVSKMVSMLGSKRADAKLDGRKPGPFLRAAVALADFAFYRPLKARIGLANIRHAYTFGTDLTAATLKALLDMGLDVRQLDISGAAVTARQSRARADSGGKPEGSRGPQRTGQG